MIRLDLPVEQSVLEYPCVAVHCPQQSERIPPALVRFVAENGRGGAAVDLDVSSVGGNKLNCLFLKIERFSWYF